MDKALKFIKDLYNIEKTAKKQKLTLQELLDLRQRKSKPILDKMHAWLVKKSMYVVPKSLLGKAVQYSLNQWGRLSGYIDFGHATPDNNLAENAIRPFVVGRNYAQLIIMLSCVKFHCIKTTHTTQIQ